MLTKFCNWGTFDGNTATDLFSFGPLLNSISKFQVPGTSHPSSSDSESDSFDVLLDEKRKRKRVMSLGDYKKKKAAKAEAMEEGEIEDSDPECSIVNLKVKVG